MDRCQSPDITMSTRDQKTMSDVTPQIDRIMQELKTCDDFTSKAVRKDLAYINTYMYPWKHCSELSEHMTKAGFAEVFPPMWNAFYGSLEKFENISTNAQSFLDICTSLTDNCPDTGTALGKCGAIRLLFQGLRHMVSNHAKVVQRQNFNDITTSILQILHNSIRFRTTNRTLYRECDGIAILKSCLDVSLKMWKLVALMILAYVANDSESGLLTSSEQSIHVLTGVLKSAVTKDSHMGTVGGHYIFSIFETLDAINHLAINDTNKMAISKDNIIPVLIQILKEEDFSVEERRVAVEALWNLAFIDSIRTSEEMQNSVPILKDLLKSEDKDLKGACESALFQIQGDQGNKVSKPSSKISPPPSYQEAISEPNQANPAQNKIQIMVSYQWDSQPRAIEIRDKLLDAGYQVWMDITNMRGNLLSGMAEAVQMSDVILLCMTERYKDSRSCRSEAAYAYRLEKNIIPLLLEEGYVPDGWLGLIQGMELYYAFYSDDQVRTNIAQLLHAIKNSLGLPPDADNEIDSLVTSSKQESIESVPEFGDKSDLQPKEPLSEPSHQPTSGKPRPDVIRDWTKDDVRDWLKDNDVEDLCSCLRFCDGEHLEMLYKEYQDSGRDSFKTELKSDYKMSSPQCIQFMVAMRRLFEDQLRVTGSPNIASNAETNAPESKTCPVTSSKQESVESVPESDDKSDSKPKEPPSEPSHQPTSGKARPDVVREWTTEDVKDWLRDNRVGDLCSCLEFCDGQHLEMLYKEYQENGRNSFKTELKSDYQMSSPQCILFMVAMTRLFDDQLRVTMVTESSDIASNAEANARKSKTCMVL